MISSAGAPCGAGCASAELERTGARGERRRQASSAHREAAGRRLGNRAAPPRRRQERTDGIRGLPVAAPLQLHRRGRRAGPVAAGQDQPAVPNVSLARHAPLDVCRVENANRVLSRVVACCRVVSYRVCRVVRMCAVKRERRSRRRARSCCALDNGGRGGQSAALVPLASLLRGLPPGLGPFPLFAPTIYFFFDFCVAIDPITLSYPSSPLQLVERPRRDHNLPRILRHPHRRPLEGGKVKERDRTCSTNHEARAIKNPTNQRQARTATARRRKKLREIPRVSSTAPPWRTCPLGGHKNTRSRPFNIITNNHLSLLY